MSGTTEGGDYFNRIPTRCRIQGSRRYPAERTYEDVHAELQALVHEVEAETGLRGELRTMPSGQGFRIDPGQPVVQSVMHAYRQLVGREQPLVGMALIGNASQFNTMAAVPTVYHGVDQTTAHSRFEHVALDDVERTAKVLVAAAVGYLGLEIGG